MLAALVAVVTALLLTTTGLAVAAALRLRSLAESLLAAFVIAFAEVVALAFVLSPSGALRRWALLAGMALLFLAAIGFWWRRGAPLPTAPRLGFLLRSPPLAALALVVGLALAYVVALIVGTPPNTWDSLTYHLARAAFWRQAGGIGDIENAYDDRFTLHPPNAEIALTFVLELTREERLVGFVQFAAALASALGIFALARRLGLARHEAAFGALLFLTLPIVLIQSSTTQNDLVAASFLIAAAVFLSGRSRGELVLAALATALAVGTKIPAAFGIPILAAIALVAPPRSAWIGRAVALAVGTAAGAYWYVVNLVRTGHPLGDEPDPTGLVALFDPVRNLLVAYARVLDAFDVSGSEGSDVYLYMLVAAGVVVALLVTLRPLGPRSILAALATGALVASPFALLTVSYALWRSFAKLHDLLGRPVGVHFPVAGWEPQNSASEAYSWFGPLGVPLVVGAAVVSFVLVRRRALPPVALVCAAAPLAWLVLFSLTLGYDPWQGRFFMFSVALSAALWGLLLRVRETAVAATAVAATTAALTLVHYVEKPSGLRLLEENVPPSVWGLERWQAQSFLRPEVGPILEFMDEEVPRDAAIALALVDDDFSYPAFGPRLERRVELVARGAQPDAQWLVASPQRVREVDRTCWRVRLVAEGGTVFERRGTCASGAQG